MGIEDSGSGGIGTHYCAHENQTHQEYEGDRHETGATSRPEGKGSAVNAGEGRRSRLLRVRQSDGD